MMSEHAVLPIWIMNSYSLMLGWLRAADHPWRIILMSYRQLYYTWRRLCICKINKNISEKEWPSVSSRKSACLCLPLRKSLIKGFYQITLIYWLYKSCVWAVEFCRHDEDICYSKFEWRWLTFSSGMTIAITPQADKPAEGSNHDRNTHRILFGVSSDLAIE